MIRTGHVARTTAETDIDLTLCLEGSGKTSVATGFGLLDHMLTLTAFWAGFDLSLTCKGDTHIDAHHSAEDIALCLGQAFALAVGDRKGIARVGFARVPMDEALAEVTLDISGRPWLEWRGDELLPPVLAGEERDVWRKPCKRRPPSGGSPVDAARALEVLGARVMQDNLIEIEAEGDDKRGTSWGSWQTSLRRGRARHDRATSNRRYGTPVELESLCAGASQARLGSGCP